MAKVVRYGRNEIVQHEDQAGEAITAGYLLERDGDSVVHQTADGTEPSSLLIANDDRDRGQELGDEYDEGDNVQYLAVSGGGYNVFLAGGETVSDGDGLVSAGDGTVRAAAGDGSEDDGIILVADEDLDASEETDPVAVATDVA